MALIAREKIPVIDQITERVYLGDIEAAGCGELLRRLEIACIVNISDCPADEYQKHPTITYLDIPDVPDHPKEPIHQWFGRVNQFIAMHAPKNVLIHCMNAVSRSVTLVLAYLIAENKWPIGRAYAYVCHKRPTRYSKPNRGFLQRLLTFEAQALRSEQPSMTWIECIRMIESGSVLHDPNSTII